MIRLHIDDSVKLIAARIGPYLLFGKDRLNSEALIQKFEELWQHGLRQAIEGAVTRGVTVSPEVVKERMRGGGLKNAERYVKLGPRYKHFECTFKALCIAQVEEVGEQGYRIDQLWFFTYASSQPQRFCFEFESEQQLKFFRDLARTEGIEPELFARRVLLEKMEVHILALKAKKDALEIGIQRLEEDARRSNIAYFTARLAELRQRLQADHPETSGDSSWQSWIHQNAWLFGSRYGAPVPKQHVGFASIPDFLFPTLDGFLDILEIKKPTAKVLLKDNSHPGSFAWTSDISLAIGQVVKYIHEIDMHQLEIVDRIRGTTLLESGKSICAVRPRAFILAGRSNRWAEGEHRALRRLNYALHGIEILTYDDLVDRGEHIVSLYTNKQASA